LGVFNTLCLRRKQRPAFRIHAGQRRHEDEWGLIAENRVVAALGSNKGARLVTVLSRAIPLHTWAAERMQELCTNAFLQIIAPSSVAEPLPANTMKGRMEERFLTAYFQEISAKAVAHIIVISLTAH